MRSDAQFEKFATDDGMIKDEQPQKQRTQRQSRLLTNYLVNTTLGQSSATDNRSNWDIHKKAYFTLLDSVVVEMSARFEGSNLDLLQSVEAMLPSSCNWKL